MGGKLNIAWKGPYTVIEVKGKNRYRLQRDDGKELKQVFSAILLKKYFPPSDINPNKKVETLPSRKRKVISSSHSLSVVKYVWWFRDIM